MATNRRHMKANIDIIKDFSRLQAECRELGKSNVEFVQENKRLCKEILHAIDILDGNSELIDWRDKSHPELLRKLCEHLEAFRGIKTLIKKL